MLPKPDPVALLNAWLAIEALQPQIFPSQEKVISEDRPRKQPGRASKPAIRTWFPFDISSGEMPWEGLDGKRAQLNLKDGEFIRWYLPLAFADMKIAVELLTHDIEPEGPEREPASGVAILALAAFDEQGFPIQSKLILSSFGWACGEVLSGRIGGLHRFIDVEEDLCREIGQSLVELDTKGSQVATTKRGFVHSMATLSRLLNLNAPLLQRPRIAIRIIADTEKESVDIINSFFLRDLHRVRSSLEAGLFDVPGQKGPDDAGPPLAAYLAVTQPAVRQDVLADKAVLEALVAPARLPLARWPTPRPARLVTLQQAAVNAALSGPMQTGLISVNGPPGTGKTTLLRDIVAAVIADRADALVEFGDPERAFAAVDLVADGGQRQTLHKLDQRLRGHGIVVASSNNAAVRNVSAELPLLDTISGDLGLRHFPGTADAVLGTEERCWGLIAAVLGNRANRADFVENAWWDRDWGLKEYLAAATGRVGRRPKGEEPAKILAAEQPPRSRSEAKERWHRACLDYREKRSAVVEMQSLREGIRTELLAAAGAQQAGEDARIAHAEAIRHVDEAEQTRGAALKALERAELAMADARRLIDASTAAQPSLIARAFGGNPAWLRHHEVAMNTLTRAMADQDEARDHATAAEERRRAALDQVRAAEAALEYAHSRLTVLEQVEAQCRDIYGGVPVGPAFWAAGHTDIHTASPWMDPDFAAARDALFASAVRLHRAFLDAAARPLKSNLGLIMSHLKGRRIPSGADLHLGDLWDSLFLVVPLVSTTFASFDRTMDGMAAGSIGWLIIDEAGQATPQAAAGAIWRARRAVVIGDPLQIEPVSTVPTGLIRAITTSYGAHPDLWAAPKASVQTLADVAGPLMTRLVTVNGVREIGMPLLVHRRCQDPMFSIANQIAYGGLMVHAPGDPASPIAAALSPWLPGSCWIDVVSDEQKWSPVEGKVVIDLLRRLGDGGIREPSIYIISPFRDIAHKLRQLVASAGVLHGLGIAKHRHVTWCESHIGTVHTFQGKEAEAVLLVLGASADNRRGSRNWAGATPNILNVAVTRAKKTLYIIGRHEVWSTAGVFAEASAELPLMAWPFDEPVPSGDGADALPDAGRQGEESESEVSVSL